LTDDRLSEYTPALGNTRGFKKLDNDDSAWSIVARKRETQDGKSTSDCRLRNTRYASRGTHVIPLVRPAGQSELESDGAGAKQHTPILKPDRIPHEHLGWTTSILMGVILIAKRIPEPFFFS